jgi:hypothetical protein
MPGEVVAPGKVTAAALAHGSLHGDAVKRSLVWVLRSHVLHAVGGVCVPFTADGTFYGFCLLSLLSPVSFRVSVYFVIFFLGEGAQFERWVLPRLKYSYIGRAERPFLFLLG